MRHRCRVAPSLRSASALALCAIAAGCSNGFSRLDAGLTTASIGLEEPSNQDVIIRKAGTNQVRRIEVPTEQPYPVANAAPAQPYPVTTGSVARTPARGAIERQPLPAITEPAPIEAAREVSKATKPVVAGKAQAKLAATNIPIVPPRRSSTTTLTAKPKPVPVLPSVAKKRVSDPAVRATPAKAAAAAPKPAAGGTYTVRSGDTVYAIARRHGIAPHDLVAWNALQDSAIRPGQQLRLSADGKAPAKVAKSEPAKPVAPVVTGSVPKPASSTTRAPVPKQPYPADPAPKVAKASTTFDWPARGRIVSRFGDTLNGVVNDGVDIAMPTGTAVRSVADGSVVFASTLENYGKLVLIRHDNGWVSAYAHAKATKVKRGDTVAKGQVVALSGETGNADSPRLHFELRRNSRPVDPLPHLPR